MRTTVTIDDELLAEAKLIAARTHRTIGSVLEDALRRLIADHGSAAPDDTFALPEVAVAAPGLRPGVDLLDRDAIADLLDESDALP